MGSSTVAYSPIGAQVDVLTEMADLFVTNAKIANDTILNAKINSAADIAGSKLANASVTAAKLSGFVHLQRLGSDITPATIDNSTTETTLGSVAVTGGTITNGAIIIAMISGRSTTANPSSGTFKLKSGVAASETERASVVLGVGATDYFGGCLVFEDVASTWSGDVSIIVTGQNSDANAGNLCTCHTIVVFGY